MLILLKHDLCFCFFFAIHSIHLSIALAQSTLAAITETTESVADKKYKLISHSSGGQQFQDQGTSTRSHSNGSSSLVHSLCRRGQRAPRDLFHKGGNPIQEVATLMTKALSKTHPAHTHCPPPNNVIQGIIISTHEFERRMVTDIGKIATFVSMYQITKK